jgi:hypothetical protein
MQSVLNASGGITTCPQTPMYFLNAKCAHHDNKTGIRVLSCGNLKHLLCLACALRMQCHNLPGKERDCEGRKLTVGDSQL